MPVITADRYLTIMGGPTCATAVPLATPAWRVVDGLVGLIDGPDVRGTDRLIPGAPGVKSYPRRPTISARMLMLVIFGDYDQDGTAYVGDLRAGMEANIAYLIANVLTAPLLTSRPDGTRPAMLHLVGGGTTTADVTVVPPMKTGAFGPVSVRATLDLSIPAGSFT